MPKVTKAHLEARRQQILDAAFACFSSAGFYQTTMQDICTKAQLSPGAVYRYFAGKEEIVEAMVEQSREQSASLIEEAKGHGSTLQVLTNLADAFFSLLDQPAALATIRLQIELWEEALHNPHVMELLRRDFDSVRQTITEIVARGQKERDINPSLDPNAVARVLISFFDGLLVQKAMDREVDVWEYVAVVKAIGAGLLWQHGPLELGEILGAPERREPTGQSGVAAAFIAEPAEGAEWPSKSSRPLRSSR